MPLNATTSPASTRFQVRPAAAIAVIALLAAAGSVTSLGADRPAAPPTIVTPPPDAFRPVILATWEGTASLQTNQFVRVVVNVIAKNSGTISIPQRDIRNLPLITAEFTESTLKFAAAKIETRTRLDFDLKIEPPGDIARGVIRQSGREWPITMRKRVADAPPSAPLPATPLPSGSTLDLLSTPGAVTTDAGDAVRTRGPSPLVAPPTPTTTAIDASVVPTKSEMSATLPITFDSRDLPKPTLVDPNDERAAHQARAAAIAALDSKIVPPTAVTPEPPVPQPVTTATPAIAPATVPEPVKIEPIPAPAIATPTPAEPMPTLPVVPPSTPVVAVPSEPIKIEPIAVTPALADPTPVATPAVPEPVVTPTLPAVPPPSPIIATTTTPVPAPVAAPATEPKPEVMPAITNTPPVAVDPTPTLPIAVEPITIERDTPKTVVSAPMVTPPPAEQAPSEPSKLGPLTIEPIVIASNEPKPARKPEVLPAPVVTTIASAPPPPAAPDAPIVMPALPITAPPAPPTPTPPVTSAPAIVEPTITEPLKVEPIVIALAQPAPTPEPLPQPVVTTLPSEPREQSPTPIVTLPSLPAVAPPVPTVPVVAVATEPTTPVEVAPLKVEPIVIAAPAPKPEPLPPPVVTTLPTEARAPIAAPTPMPTLPAQPPQPVTLRPMPEPVKPEPVAIEPNPQPVPPPVTIAPIEVIPTRPVEPLPRPTPQPAVVIPAPAPAPVVAPSPAVVHANAATWAGAARVTRSKDLAVTIRLAPDGAAYLSIPEHLIVDKPLTAVHRTDGTLRAAYAPVELSPTFHTTFDLALSDDGVAVGTMKQMGAAFPVTLRLTR